MFETILILGLSSALFAYWFRYTVLLLLSEEQSSKAGPVLERLNLTQTRAALREGESAPLDELHSALDRDYRLLLYLLNHAAGFGLRPLDHYLLILDYRVMSIWSRLTRKAASRQSRRALDEMAGVLNCIACKMGARAMAPSGA